MNADAGRPMKIVYLVQHWQGVAWYRAHVPGLALKRAGFDVEMTDRIDQRWIDQCDILVMGTQSQPKALELVAHMKAKGALTVLDIDDDYWNLAPENPARPSWTQAALDGLSAVVQAVDRVTTPTHVLANVIRPMNSDVRVLPNMLPDEHWPSERRQASPNRKPLVMGWAGSPSHIPDVRMVMPVLTQLLDEYSHLELHIAGINPSLLPNHPRVRALQYVKVEQYAGLLSGFDIGLAPLVDIRFNRCKSDLKFLEYAMVGVPGVYSRVIPYEDSVEHGVTGFLAKNNKGWLKHLRTLIGDPDRREQMSVAARQFAETRLVSTNVEQWIRAYDLKTTESGV